MARSRQKAAAVAAALVCLVSFALAGCRDQSVIEVTRVREGGEAVTLGQTPIERFSAKRDPEPEAVSITSLMRWEVPAGWQQLPPRRFREINLKNGEVDCYVTHLTAGTVQGNIARWAGQMGVGVPDAAAIEKLKTTTLFGVDAYEFEATATAQAPKAGNKMVAIYAQFPSFSFSLMLIGPVVAVDAARPAFEEFRASLQFDRDKLQEMEKQPGGEAHGGSGGRGQLAWDVPAGWKKSEGNSMRHVTFASGGSSECYITFLGGAGAGDWTANVKRWVGEVKVPMPDTKAMAEMPMLELFGKQRPYLEAIGGEKATLATLVPLPAGTMFVKLNGTPAEVKAGRPAFLEFCKSLRLEK